MNTQQKQTDMENTRTETLFSSICSTTIIMSNRSSIFLFDSPFPQTCFKTSNVKILQKSNVSQQPQGLNSVIKGSSSNLSNIIADQKEQKKHVFLKPQIEEDLFTYRKRRKIEDDSHSKINMLDPERSSDSSFIEEVQKEKGLILQEMDMCSSFLKISSNIHNAQVLQGNNASQPQWGLSSIRKDALWLPITVANKNEQKQNAFLESQIEDFLSFIEEEIKIEQDPNIKANMLNLAKSREPLREENPIKQDTENKNIYLHLNPEMLDYYFGEGNKAYGAKDYDEAIKHYEKVISMDSNHAEAYLRYGNALTKKKEYEQSIEYYRKAINIKPNCSESYRAWGITLAVQKKYEEALEMLIKAFLLNLDDGDKALRWIIALLKQRRLEEEIKKFRRTIDADFIDSESYLHFKILLL